MGDCVSLLYGNATLFGDPAVVGVTSGEIAVCVIDKDEAEHVIRNGHYSGTTSWSSNLHLGVYWDGRLIGAMQYGPAMNPASGARVVAGTTVGSWLELNRLWLDDDKPPNTASRAIACSLKLIRRTRPHVEWIQSFADERCGKWGGVYQACSFLYCGEHTSTFYNIDGTWIHKSMLQRPGVDRRGWRAGPRVVWAQANAGRATEHEFRQFRYVKFLRSDARRRLLLPVLPYPKPGEL